MLISTPTQESAKPGVERALYWAEVKGLPSDAFIKPPPRRPVLFLGAGATAACGGPLTDELLPIALHHAAPGDGRIEPLRAFLREVLHADGPFEAARDERLLPLPTLLSILDTAISSGQSLTSTWTVPELHKVRRATEYAISAALDLRLRWHAPGPVSAVRLLKLLCGALRDIDPAREPTVITTNYDLVPEHAISRATDGPEPRFPSYGCDATPDGRAGQLLPVFRPYGRVLKLHGSLNWLHCRACPNLTYPLVEDGTRKVVDEVYPLAQAEGEATCPRCGAAVSLLIVAPSHRKNYDSDYIIPVWSEARQALRDADRVFFVGYSLPWDDIEVLLLLKSAMAHVPARNVTVVALRDERRPELCAGMRARYQALFGDGLDWHDDGLDCWLDRQEQLARDGAGLVLLPRR